jgi:hypothetical protein
MWCLSVCFCVSGVGVLPSHSLLSRFVIPISLALKVALVNVPFDISRALWKKFLHSFSSQVDGFCTLFGEPIFFSRS